MCIVYNITNVFVLKHAQIHIELYTINDKTSVDKKFVVFTDFLLNSIHKAVSVQTVLTYVFIYL